MMMEYKEMRCHACAACDEAIHSGLDMEVSDKALHALKANKKGHKLM